ncbi:MAG: hypothetical protein Q8P41_21375 [Pseudomonadota bacterium]|nr:hypothetical protein [Pseudomonadota bacterium]
MKGWTTAAVVFLALVLGVLVGQGRFPAPAAAYPAGSAVSYGANPVLAQGGSVTAGSSAVLFTAPAGQDIVVTDLVLTRGYTTYSDYASCASAIVTVTVSTSAGTVGTVLLGYAGPTTFADAEVVTMSLSSGLPVAAGDRLTLASTVTASASTTYCDPNLTVGYTATGYYAEP